jgi:hypothetical protein
MRNAAIRASSMVMATIRGDIDDVELLRRFPYLLGDLVKKDLSSVQRAALPAGIYERGYGVVQALDARLWLPTPATAGRGQIYAEVTWACVNANKRKPCRCAI